MDNEHKLLISMIHDLEKAMDTQPVIRCQLVSEIMKSLSITIRRHFESEERILMFNNYPDFDSHLQEHQLLLQQLDRFEEDISVEHYALNEETLFFLKDWLARHIILHDVKYGIFFRDTQLIDHFG